MQIGRKEIEIYEDDYKRLKEFGEKYCYYIEDLIAVLVERYLDKMPEEDEEESEDWQPTDEQHEKWLKKVDDLIAQAKALKGET